jgi:hypothetical protein
MRPYFDSEVTRVTGCQQFRDGDAVSTRFPNPINKTQDRLGDAIKIPLILDDKDGNSYRQSEYSMVFTLCSHSNKSLPAESPEWQFTDLECKIR